MASTFFHYFVEKALWRHVKAFVPDDTPFQTEDAASGTQEFLTEHAQAIVRALVGFHEFLEMSAGRAHGRQIFCRGRE